MTEEEEFEFRSRLEREQATQPVAQASSLSGPTTFGGSVSELAKGLSRGLLSQAQAVGEGFSRLPTARFADVISQYISQRAGTSDPIQQAQQAASGLVQRGQQAARPTPASPAEQMMGTGAELAGAMAPSLIGMPARSIPAAIQAFAAPIAGGILGEQLGGETGKAIGALAAPIGQHMVSRLLNPQVSPQVRMLTEAGVDPTPGQILGGAAKRFEELPLVREITAASQGRAVEQFNQATLNRALAPIGGKVDKIGFEGFAQADELASAAYDRILPRLDIKYDYAFNQDLNKIKRGMPLPRIQQELSEIFDYAVKPYFAKGRGILDPNDFKSVDSTLGNLARLYGGEQNAEKRMLADGLREVQGALRTLVERQNPAYAEPLQNANQAWANLIRVERATANAGKTEGVFTPAQFQQAVKVTDSSLRHRTFAKGKAVMQDWAQAGSNVLGEAPAPHLPAYWIARAGTGGALAGGLAMGGPLGAGLATGAGALLGVYNPVSQAALASALARRPEAIQRLGAALSPGAPYALGTLPLFSQGEQ